MHAAEVGDHAEVFVAFFHRLGLSGVEAEAEEVVAAQFDERVLAGRARVARFARVVVHMMASITAAVHATLKGAEIRVASLVLHASSAARMSLRSAAHARSCSIRRSRSFTIFAPREATKSIARRRSVGSSAATSRSAVARGDPLPHR